MAVVEPPEMINAGGLVLKRWEPEWAAELNAAVHESLAELRPWMPWATDDYGPTQARAYTEHSVTAWAEGTEFNYAIFTSVGELVGTIGLMTRLGPGILEVGYWTRTPYAGRGYMTAALKVLTRVAVALPGVDRVVIRHQPANVASAAVAVKAGYIETAADGDHIIRDFRP
jgi:ribosomal-protein-serine acetyltransferase